jgi:hypothetical protein
MTAYTMTTPVETRTLVAATADTATLQGGNAAVMVFNHDTTNLLWARADGTAAAASGAGSYPVFPRMALTIPLVYGSAGSSPTVSLISTSTPTYSVAGVQG